MQRSSFALLFATAIAVAACEGRPLTGPDAQQAFRKAKPLAHTLPTGTLVLLNNARLAPGKTLDDLAPATITSIEVVKAAAARGLYGKAGENGVILISTSDTAAVTRLTVR